MIKKIIKNRQLIVEGVAMVSALYVLVAVHSFRTIYYAKNTRPYRDY
jgi:hypothetical protein